MKKTLKAIVLSLLSFILLFGFASCEKTDADEHSAISGTVEAIGLWENATYLSDVTLGEGKNTVLLDIEADGRKITVTLKTDVEMLGDAMYAEQLLNDASFFDTLNSIKADWNKDNAYWAFYSGDEYMSCGVNDTKVTDGAHYRFVYTK